LDSVESENLIRKYKEDSWEEKMNIETERGREGQRERKRKHWKKERINTRLQESRVEKLKLNWKTKSKTKQKY